MINFGFFNDVLHDLWAGNVLGWRTHQGGVGRGICSRMSENNLWDRNKKKSTLVVKLFYFLAHTFRCALVFAILFGGDAYGYDRPCTRCLNVIYGNWVECMKLRLFGGLPGKNK